MNPIRSSKAKTTALLLASLALLGIALGVSLMGTDSARSASDDQEVIENANELAGRFLHGARVVQRDSDPNDLGGSELVVDFPPAAVRTLLESSPDQVASIVDASWKSRLITAWAANQLPTVSRFRMAAEGISLKQLPPSTWSAVFGVFPREVLGNSYESMGEVSASLLDDQMGSNLSVLEEAYPQVSVGLEKIDLSDQDGDFAYSVVFTANKDLGQEELGNLILGPKIGLVGDESPLIAGISIQVVDPDGKVLAGSWSNGISSHGMSYFDRSVDEQAGLALTLQFENLTGGPYVTGSSPSTPVESQGDVG